MDKDVRIRELEARVAELEALVERLVAKIARLEKTSKTSSKPPSSDITKPPAASSQSDDVGSGHPQRPGKKRKTGGQPGHPRNLRQPFEPEQIDRTYLYEWADADLAWQPLDDFYTLQQVELRDDPLIVTEHRFRRYQHATTGRIVHAPVPDGLRQQGLFGPRLRALTATLKGELHASYRAMARLYDDVLGLPVSTGYLAHVIGQTSEVLAPVYDDLLTQLADQRVLHLDETGHPQNGKRLWLWCAVAKRFTVFKVAASRGSKVIQDLLTLSYTGVLASDFFSAYRKFLKDAGGCLASYCWAHLIRDVRFLTTLSDPAVVRWATRLIKQIRRLFKAYHRQGPRAQRNAKQAILRRVQRPPRVREATTLAKRIRQQAQAYFLFLERDDVEPTNNPAERALRHAVINRRLTQGTRGNNGQRWHERILTIRETCRQQTRSLFDYLVQAITQHTQNQPPPSLLT